jgi:hypothetical protein
VALEVKVSSLQDYIARDKAYQHDLIYKHDKNAKKVQSIVSEWDSTKFLPDKVHELNPLSRKPDDHSQDYSGVMVQLTDLYHFM